MTRLVFFLLAFSILVPALHAEEPATPTAPVAPEGWDAGRFWFADVLPPSKAWTRIVTRSRMVPRAEMRSVQREMAETYAAIWKGDMPDVQERFAFCTILRTAGRPEDALDLLGDLLADEFVTAQDRTKAARDLAAMLQMRYVTERVPADEIADRVGALKAWVDTEDGDSGSRASVLTSLARWATDVHRTEEAVALNLQAARVSPNRASSAGRNIQKLLIGSTADLAAYGPLRERVHAIFEELRDLARKDIETLRAKGAEPKRVKQAESALERLQGAEKPFAMLGEPAPAWILEEAFGDVRKIEDLRGKVVVLDFWATWCGWCIKSFPAVRDLLRDYEDRGLAVVGVTTTSSRVYASRFDLDDDMMKKAGAGGRPVPAAVLEGGRSPGPGIPELPKDEYRVQEKKILRTFIENHEMTWPVVMIDPSDPKAKYALGGWPHAVVLDREGRVRFFKSGALLRSDPARVRAVRKKIEALLEEKAPSKEDGAPDTD